MALAREVEEAAGRFGQTAYGRWWRASNLIDLYTLGHWDEALEGMNAILSEVEAGSPHYFASAMYATRALIRLGRADVPHALADAGYALELARLVKDPQVLCPVLGQCAHIFRECGNPERATPLADELLVELRAGTSVGAVIYNLHGLAWTLSALGRGRELIDVLPDSDSPWVQAAAAFAAGDLQRASNVLGAMGAVTEEARDRLWLAEALLQQNRRAEADHELQRALAFYRSVGATRYIREAEALLAVSA
jgi:tetratricopeptide (TPR) repeat protein